MKDFAFKLMYFLAFVVMAFNLVVTVKNGVFYYIDELPVGELVSSVQSPDGQKMLNIYLVENKIGAAVRGEVVGADDKAKNIFWQTETDAVNSAWVDEIIVIINDVVLDVRGSTYDSRRGTSLFQEGAVEGKAAEDYKNRMIFK